MHEDVYVRQDFHKYLAKGARLEVTVCGKSPSELYTNAVDVAASVIRKTEFLTINHVELDFLMKSARILAAPACHGRNNRSEMTRDEVCAICP